MKRKLLFVIVVLAVVVTVGTMSFGPSAYKARESSKIDEVLSYRVPGGKIAVGAYEYLNAIRANINTGTVSIEEYMAAVDASNNMQTKRTVNSVWNELGPDNVGGRTRSFLQDKDNPSKMFVGSVSGGLFVSTTRGASWTPINDFQDNLNVNGIAQNNNGIIVYGTGEGEFVPIVGTHLGGGGLGTGIFRSTDNGVTFTSISSTVNYGNVNSMASDMRAGKNIFYASTSGALRKSVDDGLTWTVVRNGNSKEVKVAVDGTVYAQSGSNIVRSTDEGQNWDIITPQGVGMLRTSIAISPQDPKYVYIMVCGNDNKLVGVYQSKDGGDNFLQIIQKSTSYFDPLISAASSQGLWDNVLSVDPLDKNHLYMGGVALAEWREGNLPKYIGSRNDLGGANPAYLHADLHVLHWDMSTTPPTLIIGCDGGLFYTSDNGKTFTMKNNGYNVTQFYAVAADYAGNVTGGSQDNGTQYINKKGNTEKSAVEINTGDGYRSEISIKNNAHVFSETYYGNISRSRDYGKSQSCIWDRRIAKTFVSLTDTNQYCSHFHSSTWAPQNTMFRLWENPDINSDDARLFIAKNGQLWMGTNVTDFQNEPIWYLISNVQGNSQVWEIEPSADGNSVFFSNSNTIYRVDGLNSATYDKWSDPASIPAGITTTNLSFTANSGRAITSINLDPNDNNVALITLGNYGGASYVYKGSSMLGTATYTNITNNLPPMPVYNGLIALSNSNLFYIATDLGVYASDNGGTTWTAQTNSTNKFPKVCTMEIRQYKFPNRNSGSIYAGTWGRGFFECQQYYTNINAVENKKKFNIIAYPNPANELVNLDVTVKTPEPLTIKVFDMTGKTVYTKVIATIVEGNNHIELDTRALKVGTYIVTGSSSSGTNYGTVKLVIRH